MQFHSPLIICKLFFLHLGFLGAVFANSENNWRGKSEFRRIEQTLDDLTNRMDVIEKGIQLRNIKFDYVHDEYSQTLKTDAKVEKKEISSSAPFTKSLIKEKDSSIYLKSYPVKKIIYSYGGNSINLPDLNYLKKALVGLSFQKEEIQLNDFIEGKDEVFQFTEKDLHALSEIPVQYLKSLGYEGIVAFPSPSDVNPLTGEDIRVSGNDTLVFVVWVSRIEDIIVQADSLSDSIKIQERINRVNEWYQVKIKKNQKHLIQRDIRFLNRWGNARTRKAKLSLESGKEPGDVKVNLNLKTTNPNHFSIGVSNSGSSTTGEWLSNLSAINYQLSGADDHLGLLLSSSNTFESHAITTFYQRPILYPDILLTGIGLGYSRYDASTYAVQEIDFEGENLFFDLFLLWKPLICERDNWSLSFGTGIRGENLKASNSMLSDFADTYLLSPNISIHFDTNSKYLKTQSKLIFSGNMLSISAVDQSSLGGVGISDQFVNLDFLYHESLYVGKWLSDKFPDTFGRGWGNQKLLTKFQFRHALNNNRLLPQHQFILGGTGSVRGYPESPVAGDYGFLFSMEYKLPVYNNPLLNIAISPFIDWGQSYINDPLFYENNHNLLGAGLGLEFQLNMGLYARIDFAQPLKEVNRGGGILSGTHSGDYRIHTSLRADF